ncbi:hypothetical protein [Maribacter sp.]|uniref:hypothetical protein n=1 Tax=Maribacter sp. TaxID=1897614 RepID=UPI0025C59311|nr:hypothetical protein [Maribacter sp.]
MKLPQTFIVLVFGGLCLFSCKNDFNNNLPPKQKQNSIKDSLRARPKKSKPTPYLPKKTPIKKKNTTKKDTLKPKFATP